jgi:hypothetical protein
MAEVTWQDELKSFVDHSGADTCLCTGEWEGATWPNQGPPHATSSLVIGLKVWYSPRGSNLGPPAVVDFSCKPGYNPAYMVCLNLIQQI